MEQAGVQILIKYGPFVERLACLFDFRNLEVVELIDVCNLIGRGSQQIGHLQRILPSVFKSLFLVVDVGKGELIELIQHIIHQCGELPRNGSRFVVADRSEIRFVAGENTYFFRGGINGVTEIKQPLFGVASGERRHGVINIAHHLSGFLLFNAYCRIV